MSLPRLLGREEAARYLGVSPKLLHLAPVTPIRLGGRCLYDRRALDAWLDKESGLEPKVTEDDPASQWLARRRRKAQSEAP